MTWDLEWCWRFLLCFPILSPDLWVIITRTRPLSLFERVYGDQVRCFNSFSSKLENTEPCFKFPFKRKDKTLRQNNFLLKVREYKPWDKTLGWCWKDAIAAAQRLICNKKCNYWNFFQINRKRKRELIRKREKKENLLEKRKKKITKKEEETWPHWAPPHDL